MTSGHSWTIYPPSGGNFTTPPGTYLGAPAGAPFSFANGILLQIAVFVDAGYLYAQGSALLAGEKQPRASLRLSVKEVLKQLVEEANGVSPGSRLLRIYCYDGLLRANMPTSEQDQVAGAADTKLRLGMVNSHGQQKGVDSLIVTDLIELARNRAIGDALILSGDEDIRIGVQVAQTFGVRIHLLGIKPARGSQSSDLIREADTHHEWDESVVGQWMRIRSGTGQADPASASASQTRGTDAFRSVEFEASVAAESKSAIEALEVSEIERYVEYLDENLDRIPADIDRPTLARLRNRLGRDLAGDERKEYRKIFASELRSARNG